MNFGLVEVDEPTQKFWNEVRDFLDSVEESVVEHEWKTGDGVNVELYRQLGERGWLMPSLPVEEGGIDATPLQCAILTKELHLHRIPLNSYSNTMQVDAIIRAYGTPELLAEVIPGVARGEVRFCLGYTEPDAGSDLASVKTRATKDGDEWIVSGQKMFTTTAHYAHYALVLARSDPTLPKRHGLTTILVPLSSPGIEITAIHTMGVERTNMVFFDDVRVVDRYRLGPVNQAWTVMANALKIEHGMGESSSAHYDVDGGLNFTRTLALTLDAAVEWALSEESAGRRPIDDVLVRNKLAEIATHVELGRLPSGPVGRVLSSEFLIKDTADLIDLIGARSLIARGEPGAVGDGWFEYAHRFAQGTAIYGGTTDIHRSMIAEQILGLPRSRAT
jgi:alkylation response protein AidB-like acyl-CoA dehydrogenase